MISILIPEELAKPTFDSMNVDQVVVLKPHKPAEGGLYLNRNTGMYALYDSLMNHLTLYALTKESDYYDVMKIALERVRAHLESAKELAEMKMEKVNTDG